MVESISAVIIGINVGRTLKGTIESILGADYPQELIEIIYVDGGSTDQSVEIARSYSGVKVIELDDPHPTPGKGRNAGLRASKHPYLLFLDGDSELDRSFLRKAMPVFESDAEFGAVLGQTVEKYRRKNFFHLLSDIEWRNRPGIASVFGGNVMVRRCAIEACEGYDPLLVAGEDPDLSYRMRQNGWKIFVLADSMAIHDIGMSKISHYRRRTSRSGYAFAAVADKHKGEPERFWGHEHRRLYWGTLLPFVFLLVMLMLGYFWIGLFLSGVVIFRSMRKVGYFQKEFGISLKEAVLYSLHLSIAPFLQLIGSVQYYLGKWGIIKPLMNQSPKRMRLIETGTADCVRE